MKIAMTWMIVLALGGNGGCNGGADKERERQEAVARAAQAQAKATAAELTAKTHGLLQQLRDLRPQTDQATAALVAAKTDAETAAAQAVLTPIQDKAKAIQKDYEAAHAAAFRARIAAGEAIDPTCIDNALARGCPVD